MNIIDVLVNTYKEFKNCKVDNAALKKYNEELLIQIDSLSKKVLILNKSFQKLNQEYREVNKECAEEKEELNLKLYTLNKKYEKQSATLNLIKSHISDWQELLSENNE